jgi:hypothetical protein
LISTTFQAGSTRRSLESNIAEASMATDFDNVTAPASEQVHTNWQGTLSHLPSWLPGDSLYGWCSRLHSLSHFRTRTLGSELFGREHAARMLNLPQGMGRFAIATRGLLGTSERILKERTVVGAYWPFATPTARQQILDAAADRLGIPISVALGLLASRVGADHPLRYCQTCCRQDTAESGAPTWKVRHQLPGVWWCLEHNEALHQVSGRAIWHKPGRDGLQLGSPACAGERQALVLMTKLARLIPGFDRIAVESLSGVLVHRLRELGVTTSSARLNQSRLDDWLEQSDVMTWMRRQGDSVSSPSGQWAVKMIRGRTHPHPLKWLILWVCAWQGEEHDSVVRLFQSAANGCGPLSNTGQMDLIATEAPPLPAVPQAVEDAVMASRSMSEAAGRLNGNLGAVRQWFSEYPSLKDAWLRQQRQVRLEQASDRVTSAIVANPLLTRSELLRQCSASVEYLRVHKPASLRELLNRIPSRTDPQGHLFA